MTAKEKLIKAYEEYGDTFLREKNGRLYFLTRTCKQYDDEVPKEENDREAKAGKKDT